MNKAKTMLHVIDLYLTETYKPLDIEGILFYGSFVEAMWGIGTPVRDIDVTVLVSVSLKDKIQSGDTVSFRLPEVGDIDINVEFLSHSDYVKEILKIEPKYLMVFSFDNWIMRSVEQRLCSRSKCEVRSSISSSSSKAFDKGKKKLTVLNDYDPVLGLKNIYHAFKFPTLMIWNYFDIHEGLNKEHAKELQIIYLMSIRLKIEKIYYSTEGSLDDKCKAVIQYAKPEWNTLMTKFRKCFPKE